MMFSENNQLQGGSFFTNVRAVIKHWKLLFHFCINPVLSNHISRIGFNHSSWCWTQGSGWCSCKSVRYWFVHLVEEHFTSCSSETNHHLSLNHPRVWRRSSSPHHNTERSALLLCPLYHCDWKQDAVCPSHSESSACVLSWTRCLRGLWLHRDPNLSTSNDMANTFLLWFSAQKSSLWKSGYSSKYVIYSHLEIIQQKSH